MQLTQRQQKSQKSMSLLGLARVRKENPAGNTTFFNI